MAKCDECGENDVIEVGAVCEECADGMGFDPEEVEDTEAQREWQRRIRFGDQV